MHPRLAHYRRCRRDTWVNEVGGISSWHNGTYIPRSFRQEGRRVYKYRYRVDVEALVMGGGGRVVGDEVLTTYVAAVSTASLSRPTCPSSSRGCLEPRWRFLGGASPFAGLPGEAFITPGYIRVVSFRGYNSRYPITVSTGTYSGTCNTTVIVAGFDQSCITHRTKMSEDPLSLTM
jgi:hypothetical protein